MIGSARETLSTLFYLDYPSRRIACARSEICLDPLTPFQTTVCVVANGNIALRKGRDHAQTNDNNDNCNASHAYKYHTSNCIEGELNSSHTLQNTPLGLVRVKRYSICTTRKQAFWHIRLTFDWWNAFVRGVRLNNRKQHKKLNELHLTHFLCIAY